MRKIALALPFLMLDYVQGEPVKKIKPGYTVYSYGPELFYDIYSNGTLNVYCKHNDCSFLKGSDGIQNIKSFDISKEIQPGCSSRPWFNRRFNYVRRKIAGKKKA
jgi:hypothetical protein